MVNRRGVIAAVLGFLYPGLGHAYLRKWIRALVWFGVAIGTAALVVPDSAYGAFQAEGVSGLMEASENFGIEVTLSLLAIRVLNVVDAYLIAVRQAGGSVVGRKTPAESGDVAESAEPGDAVAGEPEECPVCGKELDEDLDFCPWCTTRLDSSTDADAESA